MATNPFANASQAAINEIENLALSALPTVAVAILALVAAIVGFWFVAKLFGFDIGLSETAKQRIRAKAAKRNAAFPFAFSKRSAKVAAEGGPWQKPNSFEQGYQFDTSALEDSFNFFKNVVSPNPEFTDHLTKSIKYRLGITDRDLSYTELSRGLEAIIQENADAVYDAWDQNFSHIGSIRGLASSNLDVKTKSILMMHAARIARRRMQAMAENQKEWAAHYADGDEHTNFKFVA